VHLIPSIVLQKLAVPRTKLLLKIPRSVTRKRRLEDVGVSTGVLGNDIAEGDDGGKEEL